MGKAENLQKSAVNFFDSMASLLKVALKSRKASPKGKEKRRSLIIMGNGPSLRTTIDNNGAWLEENDLMAVNFAANTPDFFHLQPELYIMADGHFFSGRDTDPNVRNLWKALARVDWDMTLWIPHHYCKKALEYLSGNSCVKVKVFNLTPLEGWRWICHKMIDQGLGMPRPRNVMIPAIICGMREGYMKIYLVGADHTWTRTLSVDDENFVLSVQPHFYEDNEKEHERVRATYAGLHLHDVLGSMTVAFRSYWHVAEYAKKKGVDILNATPGSMIDAFPRFNP